jgi:hypothetical protein
MSCASRLVIAPDVAAGSPIQQGQFIAPDCFLTLAIVHVH